jgi:hypothetical protein
MAARWTDRPGGRITPDHPGADIYPEEEVDGFYAKGFFGTLEPCDLANAVGHLESAPPPCAEALDAQYTAWSKALEAPPEPAVPRGNYQSRFWSRVVGDPEPAPPARRAGGKVQAWSDRQDGGSQVEEWLAEMGRTSMLLRKDVTLFEDYGIGMNDFLQEVRTTFQPRRHLDVAHKHTYTTSPAEQYALGHPSARQMPPYRRVGFMSDLA